MRGYFRMVWCTLMVCGCVMGANQGHAATEPQVNLSLPAGYQTSPEGTDARQEMQAEAAETYQINHKMLRRNTGAVVWTGVGTMGILYLMPSSFTNWDSDDDRGPFKKWWDNVSGGPVWDKDDFFLNYVTHPYAGAIYYMGARSAGASPTYSFWYSFALSTFFWECGIEAFAEKPSIQDLIVTPVAGSILGEGFYLAKQHIVENNKEIYGSKALGKTALFLMDPITEIADLLFNSPKDEGEKAYSMRSQPFISGRGNLGYAVNFQMTF